MSIPDTFSYDIAITLDNIAAAKAFYDEKIDLNIPERGLPCQLESVLESECLPTSSIVDQLDFCGNYVKGNICVPVFHQVWPEWSIKSKDFLVEELAVLYMETRLL